MHLAGPGVTFVPPAAGVVTYVPQALAFVLSPAAVGITYEPPAAAEVMYVLLTAA